MGITKEQWKEVEERLASLWRGVEFRLGDTVVTYVMRRETPFKNVLMTYVDGEFCGAWLNSKQTYPQQIFLNHEKQALFRQKDKAAYKKLGKRALKSAGVDLNKSYTYLTPYWRSIKNLIRHLKTIEGLELAPSAPSPDA
ncbi:MAG: hypothetical protein AB7E47_05935 [Desulfovibrionaceae bacterium]